MVPGRARELRRVRRSDRALARDRAPGCAGAACAELAARAPRLAHDLGRRVRATRAGRQSEALLDRTMRCLDQRRLEHPELARQAADARCAIVAVARLAIDPRRVRDPRRPRSRAADRSARRCWLAAAAWVAHREGDRCDSVIISTALDELAPQLRHDPRDRRTGSLTADAALVLGDRQLTRGQLDAAEATLDVGLARRGRGERRCRDAELLLRLAH